MTGLEGTARNTLSGMEVSTMFEGAMAEELARLQAEATAAAQAQAQASQQLQEAAAAPPSISPFAVGIPQLLGNIASVIGQDKGFAERGRATAREERQTLMQARKDNLSALQQNFKEQADAARQAGDLLAEAQMRTKLASTQKQLEVIMQGQTQDFQASEKEKDRKAMLEAARIRAADGGAGDFSDEDIISSAEAVRDGAEITSIPIKMRPKVITYMKQQGYKIVPRLARKGIDELAAAEAAVNEIATLSEQVNTATTGPGRFATGVQRGIESFFQTNVAAAVYENTRGGLAGNLSRAIQAERGVLTNQDRAYAMSLVPARGWASQEVARDMIARLQRFIGYKRASAMRAYTTDLGLEPGAPTDKAPKQRVIRTAKVPSEIRHQALSLALDGDKQSMDALDALIEKYPDLNNDDDIIGIIGQEQQENIEAVQGSQPQ